MAEKATNSHAGEFSGSGVRNHVGSKGGSFGSLRFPQDLGTSEAPYYIRFQAGQVQYGGTKGIQSGAGDFSVRRSTGSGGENPAKLAEDPSTVSKGIETLPNTVFDKGSINLYLPPELGSTTSANYATTELGQMGAKAVDTLRQSSADTFEQVDEGVMEMFKAAVQDMTHGNDKLKASFAVSKGRVSNNFSFQIFEGMGHRSFSYSFTMVARDPSDSVNIRNICDTFLFYMLPSKSPGDFNFFEIPCQWNIGYFGPSGPLQYHQQPNACFLTNVAITYGGDAGSQLYTDGAPMITNLTVDFTEIEPLHRGGS